MALRQIWLSKNGGTEIDADGWREFMALCPNINFLTPSNDIDDVIGVFGGIQTIYYTPQNFFNDNYVAWGTPTGSHCSLIDSDTPRFGVYLANFPISDTAGEHFNCMYVNVRDDVIQGMPIIDGTWGVYVSYYYDTVTNFTSPHNYETYTGERKPTPEECIQPDDVINGNVEFNEYGFRNVANIGQFLADTLTIYTNIPVFLRLEDLQNYLETGEKHNCLNEIQTVEEVGGDYNKYCQTTIFTMDANGHNKAQVYDYYYTYKMTDRQNIVGYVLDDGNIQNVRFKAKNLTERITIVDEQTGETFFVTGYDFNHNGYGYSYGCSTKREHETREGKICWGVFGRMNIYIFDSEEKADDYLENDDPSLALNYDDIDNYDERNANKTGEDAGDQNTQNNALVEGWAEPSLSNVYILNSTKMGQVANLVFPDVTTAGELPDQIKELKASLGLYGENPINDIIDVWHCPFNPYNLVERDNKNLWFGSYRSNITATHVTAHGKLSNFGACTINPIYNDFRDYDIEITLYLPYFGAVDLAPDIFMGKTLNIKVTADLRSHNVRYYLFADQTLIQYHDCAVGTCYPLMGQDVAGKANQVMHAYNSLQTAKRNTALSMGVNAIGMTTQLARGDVMGAVSTGVANEQSRNNVSLQEKQLAQDVKYTQPARSVVGNASPACSENDIPYPYIIFKIPQTVKPPLLQSAYGLPCNVITQLANVHGYTQIDNIQLQTSAPERIKADIIRRLQSGVYLP